jgi:protoheme IX farnesyltransferase
MSMGPLADLLLLVKFRLCLGVACSAALGWLLRTGARGVAPALLFASVLALACGAGCLNNVQDARLDRAFARTRGRPLPAGRIRPARAVAIAALLLGAGLAGLFLGPFPPACGWTGLLSVLCYNAVYTPLKRRTLYALVPGVVCGALPPLIGWLAAGGPSDDLLIAGVMIASGLWQPPHFWLVVLKHHADYRQGAIPSMLSVFSRGQVTRILFAWVVALAVALLALPLAARADASWLAAAVATDAVLLVVIFAGQIFARPAGPSYRLLFALLNLAVLAAVALVALHRRLAG